MDSIISFISAYVSYWPLAVFVALILAGLNLPVSEDALIILSAAMVHENKNLLIPTYLALYFGIVISDMMVFFIGRLLSKGFLQFKFLKKKLTPEKMEWISAHLEKHGLLTFITCRFIPFGVRNGLFMGSGFVGLPYIKFVCFDTIAAFISSITLFTLVYFIGNAASNIFSTLGIVLFIILVVFILVFLFRFIAKRRNSKNTQDE